jgi:hypothetical protein
VNLNIPGSQSMKIDPSNRFTSDTDHLRHFTPKNQSITGEHYNLPVILQKEELFYQNYYTMNTFLKLHHNLVGHT